KGESRGKITSKISGTAGANLPSAAEMVAGLEAGVASAMLEQLVGKASKLEETDKKIDSQIDKIMSATAGLASAAIAATRAIGDFGKGVAENLDKYKKDKGGNAWGEKGSQLLQEIGDFFSLNETTRGKQGANSFWNSKAGGSILGIANLGASAVGGRKKGTKDLNVTGTGGAMGMFGGGAGIAKFNKAKGEAQGQLEAKIKSRDPNIKTDSEGNIDPAALRKYMKEHKDEPDMKADLEAFGEATTAAAENYLQSESGILKGAAGAVVGLAFAWMKLGAALLTGDLLDWGTRAEKFGGVQEKGQAGEAAAQPPVEPPPPVPEPVTPEPEVTGGTIDEEITLEQKEPMQKVGGDESVGTTLTNTTNVEQTTTYSGGATNYSDSGDRADLASNALGVDRPQTAE
ncbi:hypothetical protein NO1_2253, partial [Candidatus Termititenax aidoneus]